MIVTDKDLPKDTKVRDRINAGVYEDISQSWWTLLSCDADMHRKLALNGIVREFDT